MKIPVYLFCIIFFFAVNQFPAYCQTNYSLFDLALLADKQSETIKIAKEDVFIAQQDKKRALSVLIPRATAFGSMTEYKDADVSAPSTVAMGVKLTQSFTLNGKELIALDVTKKYIVGKEFSLETVRSQYLLQVTQTYFNILSSQKSLEIAQSDIERLTAHKNAVQEKLSVGSVTKQDLYRAKAELSKAMTDEVIAENRVLQSKANLQNLVIIDDDFTLKQDNLKKIEKYESNLEDIQTQALKNRPEIQEAMTNLEIAKKTIKFQKSDYWPTISLEAGYKETDFKFEDTFREDYDREDTYFTGELIFTIFSGGLRGAEVKQALADLRKAENSLSLQKKQIILEAKVNFLANKAAKSALLNLQDEIKSAQENFNAVQMQFKYGMADSIDIMDANTLLVSAQRRISDAQYIYYLSVLEVLYTKGELSKLLLTQAN
ncbi:MAG: TolC family protein [Thermodesulfobacteriota bacterium]